MDFTLTDETADFAAQLKQTGPKIDSFMAS